MKGFSLIASVCVLSAFASTSFAADIAAGKAKAATCGACHGANGISSVDIWPSLAGQKKGYLKKQLQDFKSGKRADPMMSNMAKPLSDTDIDNLAAYYSSLK